jgi:hypothetical protein
MDGNVIGITVKKVADGISYSIPIEDAFKSLKHAMHQNVPAYTALASIETSSSSLSSLSLPSDEESRDGSRPHQPTDQDRSKTEDKSNNDSHTKSMASDPRFSTVLPFSMAEGGVPVMISRRW